MRKCSATSSHILFDFAMYRSVYVGVAFRALKRLLAGRQILATDAGPLRPAKGAIDARGNELGGMDPTLATMIKHGGPLTRERWMDLTIRTARPSHGASSTSSGEIPTRARLKRSSSQPSGVPISRSLHSFLATISAAPSPQRWSRPHPQFVEPTCAEYGPRILANAL